ncbi:MAG TPA: VacB/RNase II family 3'-5' exoribonuclease, partial [Balneolaceae bacterium]|nr:VacB/RNase II family 3'-5' exoribonuclease [Balneolaceae bacterium]
MPKNKQQTFEAIILDILQKNPKVHLPFEGLQQILKVSSNKDNQALKDTINNLYDRGLIAKKKGGGIQLKKGAKIVDKNKVTGRLDISRHGTGYLIAEGFEEDIKIKNKHLGTALPDDIVTVSLRSKKGSGGRPKGKVVNIVERGRNIFAGVLKKQGKQNYIIEPDPQSAHTNFFILPQNTGGAKSGDKVIFELVEWSHPQALPEARITQILGKQGTNEANMLSILAENQISAPFPDEVEEFAEGLETDIPPAEIERRTDLREEQIFTIDPDDANDFDDAISIKKLKNGNFYLGVHIADVTHYMPRDSVLDQEAKKRGTSTYLVDRVIPMLPEKLSNEACSLRPDEDSLTFSCFMELTPKGKLKDYSIEQSVIHSKKRFSYEQAQKILDGKKSSFAKSIKTAAELAEILVEKRFREGSIQFETPEPKFILDAHGKPVDVIVKERTFAHKLIEECMLMANQTVAIHVKKLRQRSNKKETKDLFPFFYRVHAKPDLEKLQNLAETVKPLGINFKPHKNITSSDINTLLNQVEGTAFELTVNDLLLRAMAKAEYSPDNIGHFGLGFSNYAHFTSPIRRYPDVIV